MPSYRIDEAPTGRAGCQNKECKDNKVKILKGELRLGSWVDTERFQSFFWRHWGCVTPKIISHVNDLITEESDGNEKNLNMLDGFEDLSSEHQEKVAKALKQGHVDDEDWKGDPELNEPGKSGFRKRTSKKAKAAADVEEKGETTADEEPAEPKKSKKRARGKGEIQEPAIADETPKPKRPKRKPTSYPKIDPSALGSDEDEDVEAPVAAETKAKTPRRGHPSKEAASSGSRRGKKAKNDADNSGDAEPVAKKPNRGRKRKAA